MKARKVQLGFFGLCLLAVFTMSCMSGVAVKQNYITEEDFGKLKTYNWMDRKPGFPPSSALKDKAILHGQIVKAVNSQLEAKGLKQETSNPDFLITYHIGEEDKLDVTEWGYTYARPRRYYYERGKPNVTVHRYKEGSLVLDFVNAKNKELIWRGTATAVVETGQPDVVKDEKRINEAARKLLRKFPPSP